MEPIRLSSDKISLVSGRADRWIVRKEAKSLEWEKLVKADEREREEEPYRSRERERRKERGILRSERPRQ